MQPQYILGVYPTHHGLSINPCIPEGFGDFDLVRKYRGTTYQIHVANPENVQKGVKEMIVDGVKVDGCIIPVSKKDICEVTIVMG